MYNFDIKEQFMMESESRNLSIRIYMTNIFNKAEKFEEMYGCDLYDFHMDNIIEFYKSFCTSSVTSLRTLNSQLDIYARWAMERNLIKDHQNHYAEIGVDTLANSCINKSLATAKTITREELIHILNGDAVHNVADKVLLLGIFEGVSGFQYDDIINLKAEDLYYSSEDKKYYAKLEHRLLEVSDRFYNMAIESANTYEYRDVKTGDICQKMHYAEEDKRCIKMLSNAGNAKSENKDARRMYFKLLRIREVTGCAAIDQTALKESGRREMIMKYCLEDKCDPETAIKKHLKDIEYRYGKIRSIPQYILSYYSELGE